MSFRSFFSDHLWLKAFSLVLATLIWLTIHGSLDQDTREVTKRFEHQAITLLVDSTERRSFLLDTQYVSVTVKGPRGLLESLGEVHPFVEINSHAGNTANYNVEVHVPAGVTEVHVTPKTVFVKQADVP